MSTACAPTAQRKDTRGAMALYIPLCDLNGDDPVSMEGSTTFGCGGRKGGFQPGDKRHG